jgi:hypothetical protein
VMVTWCGNTDDVIFVKKKLIGGILIKKLFYSKKTCNDPRFLRVKKLDY